MGPLRISSNGRYLLENNGTPIWLQVDSGWELFTQLNQSDVQFYLDTRVAQGFNACLCEFMDHQFSPGGTTTPNNANGDTPFTGTVPSTTSQDFTTPNEPYWANNDWVIDRAAERGIFLLATPAYTGFLGTQEGWYDVMADNGTARLATYGNFIGSRYASKNNLVYVHGGDRNPANIALVDAVANGIRAKDPTKLFTAHAAPETSAADEFGAEGWLDINSTYSYDGISTAMDVYNKYLIDYNRSTVRPYLGPLESQYEQESADPQGNAWTAQRIRRQSWWGAMCGACGQTYGNIMWRMTTAIGWKTHINDAGATHMQILAQIMKPRRWYDCVPDQSHAFVTSGFGTSGALDYLAAMIDGRGELAMLYMPTSRSFTIDATQMKKPFNVTQYDPTNGTATLVSGSPFACAGSKTFSAPGTNASGSDNDWVYVFEAANELKITPHPISVNVGFARR